jgi:uncharacterized membrane protein
MEAGGVAPPGSEWRPVRNCVPDPVGKQPPGSRFIRMEARAKLLGHPIHQMLVVLPLGLLVGSFIFDLMFLATGAAHWADVAFWMIIAGIISGLIAAVFGFIDWLAIPSQTRAKSVGLLHAVGNVIMLGLFLVSWLVRRPDPLNPEAIAFVLSGLGVALSGVTGWLGGELVDRLGIGVSPGAHLNAPSSLLDEPAAPGVYPESAGGPH